MLAYDFLPCTEPDQAKIGRLNRPIDFITFHHFYIYALFLKVFVCTI